jgi:NAD(P)H-hydrate epimerase
MAGAAVLCARGALRSGAGLVQMAVPDELFPVIHAGIPEATCISRSGLFRSGGDSDGKNANGAFLRGSKYYADVIGRASAHVGDSSAEAAHVGDSGAEALSGRLSRFDAIAVGSGMGNTAETRSLIVQLTQSYSGTLVIDADGLNAVAGKPDVIKSAKCRVIITPHMGEAARLLGTPTAELKKDRRKTAEQLVLLLGCTAVLKGAGTLVFSQDGRGMLNKTGNPGMATAGSGDVLTGMIASLAAQGLEPFEAAAAGVCLHGAAGDLAAAELGEYGLIASDIAAKIPAAIMALQRSHGDVV